MLLHLSIDDALFFLQVEKNQLLTVNKVAHSSIAYRSYPEQVKTASQGYHLQTQHLFAERAEHKVRVV